MQPLVRAEEGPVFAEPWQAQAFALTVKLSEQGHFTWKEWAAALAHELQAAAARGEPDDGTRYYEHWLAALERLVADKGLTDSAALVDRKDAWTNAYLTTPHGRPVELRTTRRRLDRSWLVVGFASTAAAFAIVRATGFSIASEAARFAASAGLGTLLGMRHALEPDHLAALSVLLTGERSVRTAAWLGAYWGIGHTLTLLVAGSLLVVLRAEMPAVAADVLACGVAAMLVGFGIRAIYLSSNPLPAAPTHSHGHGPWTIARRPLLVGAVHGLAGSGALTALVMSTIPTLGARLIYLLLFGVGSTVGMAALSGLLGWPIARVGTGSLVARGVSFVVGSLSILLGLYWGAPLIARWISS